MKIKIGFFAVLLFLSFYFTNPLFFLASLLAVLLHELGHILMARLCGIHLRECAIGLFGAGLTPSNDLYSYSHEILLCLAGPLMNFLSSVLFFFLFSPSVFLQFFLFSSISLGILNLIPIRGFDGGRIVSALLSLRLAPSTSSNILSVLSFFFIFLLWSCSVYLLLKVLSTLSLFIFSLSLFFRIFLSED